MSIAVAALSGGVGGAKLASGMSRAIEPGSLLVAANTGDDFSHMSLHISPDIDSVFYALSDLNNTETGWGRVGETWNFMAAIKEFGGEDWFNLGDSDLAMHVLRSHRLAQGASLSEITEAFCKALGVPVKLVPASDDPISTIVETDNGAMPMQDYFARERCKPVARRFCYKGASEARANVDLVAALKSNSLRAVVICPSNPFLSIDPILAVPELRELIKAASVPVIAVSPIVGGQAVKGPLGKIMGELGLEVNSCSIARHYDGLIDALVIDEADAHERVAIEALNIRVHTAPTIMNSVEDKEALARAVLGFVGAL